MDTLEEAKEIMEKIGCNKVFAEYSLEMDNIADIKSYDEQGEIVELEGKINTLKPIIEKKLFLDQNKPIECPLNSSMNKYIEFSLKNKNIKSFNISDGERDRIEEMIKPLLDKYDWIFKK